jgi:hypothetical protein
MNMIIIVLNKKRIVNLRLENMNLDIKYPCAILEAGDDDDDDDDE